LLTVEQELAALRWQAAELDLAQTQTELSLQLLDNYRLWWHAKTRVDTIRVTLARLNDLVTMMNRRATAGVSSDSDVDLTQAHISRTQDELIQAENNLRQAQSDLEVSIGQPLVIQSVALQHLPAWPYRSSPEMTERMIDISPAVANAEMQHAIALKQIERTKSSSKPTINMTIERQWGAYYGSTPPGDRVYLSSQLSLGAGLSNLKQQEQAQVQAESSRQQIQVARQRIEATARRLWEDHELALRQLRNAQQLVTRYDDITDSYLRLFASGRRSWLDMLNLTREHHQLRMQWVDAQANILSAHYRMALLCDQWTATAQPAFNGSTQ
jgi:adhesin transport system outer membrane protein